jgi:predicted DCC family thiol-disulfide oxidoreductase YuxK
MNTVNQREHGIVLFDGYCNLCSGSVQFIIKRDPGAYFRFASLQSKQGTELIETVGTTSPEGESVILIENGKVYSRSTAALRIARRLTCAWPLLAVFLIVPPFIRNAVYDWISRNRYKWFGKKETCWLGEKNEAHRFLD